MLRQSITAYNELYRSEEGLNFDFISMQMIFF